MCRWNSLESIIKLTHMELEHCATKFSAKSLKTAKMLCKSGYRLTVNPDCWKTINLSIYTDETWKKFVYSIKSTYCLYVLVFRQMPLNNIIQDTSPNKNPVKKLLSLVVNSSHAYQALVSSVYITVWYL